jgi:general stress protein 26
MSTIEPVTHLDGRYSDAGVTATPWPDARSHLETAELFWVTTVRRDGRPHTTPTIAVWHDDALCFSTGPDEQKAKNLAHHSRCSLLTGTNTLHGGLDIVVEGDAVRVTDDVRLRRLAERWEAKYGTEWHFDVADGAFRHGHGTAYVFAVTPEVAYGFSKDPYRHTRWHFDRP